MVKPRMGGGGGGGHRSDSAAPYTTHLSTIENSGGYVMGVRHASLSRLITRKPREVSCLLGSSTSLLEHGCHLVPLGPDCSGRLLLFGMLISARCCQSRIRLCVPWGVVCLVLLAATRFTPARRFFFDSCLPRDFCFSALHHLSL